MFSHLNMAELPVEIAPISHLLTDVHQHLLKLKLLDRNVKISKLYLNSFTVTYTHVRNRMVFSCVDEHENLRRIANGLT